MSNKFKSAHRCPTPTLMMRSEGARWHCPECGVRWRVVVKKSKNILGMNASDKYWLRTSD